MTALASLWPANAFVFELAHEQQALTGYVHPFDFRPDFATLQGGLPHELPVDVALGKVDFLEVMGYSDHLITSEVWYRLLNCGFRVPAAAGTDAFPNFAQLRGPPGLVRTYVRAGPQLDHRQWLRGLREGRSFVTNAPLLRLSLNGAEAGDTLPLAAVSRDLRARVWVASGVPLDHVEIVQNGRVIASLATDPRTALDTSVTLPATAGWYVLRAYADAPKLPVLDLYPFATTSPVYVTAATPSGCGEDAVYLTTWIDLLRRRVETDTSWNTPAEKAQALELLARARQVYQERR